jgi:1D-myo-inositol-tetrakisphosphate 5-kinase/inositol-polyphosphate multikinase
MLSSELLYIYNSEVMYMKMDDMGFGLGHPVVIDFKMGRKTCDPEANLDKIAKHKVIYPHIEEIGYRIAGMRVRTF